jgi:hypothetical protein
MRQNGYSKYARKVLNPLELKEVLEKFNKNWVLDADKESRYHALRDTESGIKVSLWFDSQMGYQIGESNRYVSNIKTIKSRIEDTISSEVSKNRAKNKYSNISRDIKKALENLGIDFDNYRNRVGTKASKHYISKPNAAYATVDFESISPELQKYRELDISMSDGKPTYKMSVNSPQELRIVTKFIEDFEAQLPEYFI